MITYKPKYIHSYNSGILDDILNKLYPKLKNCNLCPRKCSVNRMSDIGICKTGRYAKVASYGPHFGEEKPLVGNYGSGTIFFSNCNLLCNFCQNFDLSHEGEGTEVNDSQLADIMIYLQSLGCHNINFVTPSHVVPQIISALKIAIENGLHIPLIYNTSAYDDIDTINNLDGLIDIYMPDLKFSDSNISVETCNASNYYGIAKNVIREMYNQVGQLDINNQGIAETGLLIRHLVMPNNYSGSKEILSFIKEELSADTYINIMAQYRPAGKAFNNKNISRSLKRSEFEDIKFFAGSLGFHNFL